MTDPVIAKAIRRGGRRPWLAFATLVVVLLGFGALAVRAAMSLGAPDVLEQKVAAAERYIYYRVTPQAGPTFQLAPGDTAIRFVTHVVVPKGAYDPLREFEYGIRVVVNVDGKKWVREIHTRSRQSKGRPENKIWLDENTFVPDFSLELTDDRLLVVALPPITASTTASVTLLGEIREGYVRAYAPMARDNVARRVRDLPDRDRSRIAAQVGYLPWDRIEAVERLTSMRFVERRLSAEGKEGPNYQTRTLYTTGFRLRTEAVVERGQQVGATHGAAYNVVGPARLDLTITRPLVGATAGVLELVLVGEGTPPAPLQIQLPGAGAKTTTAVDVPAGVFSLTLVATATARVEVSSDKAAALGGGPLVPLEQVATAYVTSPVEGVTVPIEGPEDLLSRVFRIDVRALASMPAADLSASAFAMAPVSGEITIETLDGNGRVIGTLATPFDTVPSWFELAKLHGKLAAAVCEPASFRFVVPPGGRAVRVRTDKVALVQVLTPIAISPPLDRLDAPFDSVVLTTMKWRYARFIERGWLALRPHDLPADRVAMLVAQTRLEPKTIPPVSDLRATALAATGTGAKQTIIERVAAEDAAEFVQRWDAGHYTRVVPGKPMQLDLGRLPSRAQIRYRADDASVGAAIAIDVDGAAQQDTLSSARGSLRLPSGLAGTHTLRVDAPANVELLVDRPPAKMAHAELYALRTVNAIEPGRTVRMKIVKRSNAQQNVNIVLYTATPASSTVRITIDGGSPARISGTALAMWTLADRTVQLPPVDRPATLGFADTTGGKLYPRRVVIALGDDLPAGEHVVEVSTSTQAWARFFTLDDTPVTPRALQWRETLEDAP